jgi:hypothetical protein
VNNWTRIIGNHTFKWGIDLRRVRDDLLQDQTFSPRGLYTFSADQSSDASANGKTNIANDMPVSSSISPARPAATSTASFPHTGNGGSSPTPATDGRPHPN